MRASPRGLALIPPLAALTILALWSTGLTFLNWMLHRVCTASFKNPKQSQLCCALWPVWECLPCLASNWLCRATQLATAVYTNRWSCTEEVGAYYPAATTCRYSRQRKGRCNNTPRIDLFVHKQSVYHDLITLKLNDRGKSRIFSTVSQGIMPNSVAALCRAARFCNGAAHGGQVVGPSTIVPGLLQAWGCAKIPDAQFPGTDLQVCLTFHHLHVIVKESMPF